MSELHCLIFMFATGILIRFVDRMDHAAAGPDATVPTWGAYLKQNAIRLVVRLLSAVAVFVIARENGELTTKLSALLGGYGVDTAVDSLLQRKDRMGNGNGKSGAGHTATLAFCAVLLSAALLLGCGRMARVTPPDYSWEQRGRDGLVAGEGFLRKAKANHKEECDSLCTLERIKDKNFCVGICNWIKRMAEMHKAAVVALDGHCGRRADGTPAVGWYKGTDPCRGMEDARAAEAREAVANWEKARDDARAAGVKF